MIQYLALLRGINVGGKNLIKMADLKAGFEEQGFASVRTYIQSGNVLFFAPEQDLAGLASRIEQALSAAFDYQARLVLRSHAGLQAVVANAPAGFGREPEKYRSDVIFLKEPLGATEALQSVSLKEGVDQAHPGEGVLYFARLASRASQSRLARIVGLPVYQSMTIRNWKTTTRLLEMMDAAG